jgi:hypothetical protein
LSKKSYRRLLIWELSGRIRKVKAGVVHQERRRAVGGVHRRTDHEPKTRIVESAGGEPRVNALRDHAVHEHPDGRGSTTFLKENREVAGEEDSGTGGAVR